MKGKSGMNLLVVVKIVAKIIADFGK